MEIDFNPSRIPSPDLGQSIARKGANSAASSDVAQGTSTPAASALLDNINTLPTVRPEKVALAKELLASTTYPPVELLTRIANLLAVHLKN